MRNARPTAFAIPTLLAAAILAAACAHRPPVGPSLPAEANGAEKLPPGEKVVDRGVEVTGGAEAHGRVRTRVMRGTMSMPAFGIEGPITLWQKEPDLLYMQVELAGLGTMLAGHDGKIAWQQDSMTGPRILEGEERAIQVRDAEINPADWRRWFSGAETVAVADVDGKEAYKVVLTPNEGKPVTHYYDRDSGLLVRSESTAETQMGDLPVTTDIEDYRETGGLLLPRTVRQRVMGVEQRFSFDSVEDNVELPAGRFEPPAEVAALAEKAAASGAAE